MSFIPGQGILGRTTYPDGTEPAYDRTYLVISATADYIEILNVSSIQGKERKLAFPTNERIRRQYPPFIKPSFAKLDSLARIPAADFHRFRVLCNGRTLDSAELARIKAKI